MKGMSSLNEWAIAVPIIRATRGEGIFVKYLELFSRNGHKKSINKDGTDTISASIFTFARELTKFLKTSWIFFYTSKPTNAFICVRITMTPIPHIKPAITEYGV